MANKIICVIGMAGSGKSLVADQFKKQGFEYLRFGQITLNEIKKRGLKPTEKREKEIRERLRRKHGMGAFALLNLPKIDQLLKKESNIVVDGLYSWTEYKILKEKYGRAIYLIAVFASPEVRYQRLESRNVKNDKNLRFRPFSKKESKKRDYAEIENIEKGGPIAMADFTIVNTGTVDELKVKVKKILKEV